MSIGREPAAGRSPQERAACSRREGTSPAVSPTPGCTALARRRNVRPSPRLHPRISPTGRRALSPGPSGDARPVPRTVPTCGTSQYGRIASKCVWLPWTGRPQDSRMGGIGHGGCWRGCPRDGSGGVRTVIESFSPGPANRGSARDSSSRSPRSSSRDAAHSAPCRSASPSRRRSSASARSLAATMRLPRSRWMTPARVLPRSSATDVPSARASFPCIRRGHECSRERHSSLALPGGRLWIAGPARGGRRQSFGRSGGGSAGLSGVSIACGRPRPERERRMFRKRVTCCAAVAGTEPARAGRARVFRPALGSIADTPSRRLAGRGPRRAPGGICGAGRPLRGGADGSGAGARDRRSEVFRTKRLESIRDSAAGAARGHSRPIDRIALDSS